MKAIVLIILQIFFQQVQFWQLGIFSDIPQF